MDAGRNAVEHWVRGWLNSPVGFEFEAALLVIGADDFAGVVLPDCGGLLKGLVGRAWWFRGERNHESGYQPASF